jgi:hypothetical protein
MMQRIITRYVKRSIMITRLILLGAITLALTASAAEPPAFVLQTTELSAGTFSVRVPTGNYTAPAAGAANYAAPGPIVAFKGADGVWRGHGYLETYPRLMAFTGKVEGGTAQLTYTFEGEKKYEVTITAKDGVVLLDESSQLGPRNLYVFDAYYGQWEPTSGFAVDWAGKNHAFLFLPCYYDKPEVTVNPSAADASAKPGGAAILSADPGKKDVAGFWCRAPSSWTGADTMGFQLWQRRQLPGDLASRHFLGPDTKSDSTPNPRTAPLLGKSLYEGHVTIEFSLGVGTRKLGFAVTGKGESKETIPVAFKKLVEANQ